MLALNAILKGTPAPPDFRKTVPGIFLNMHLRLERLGDLGL